MLLVPHRDPTTRVVLTASVVASCSAGSVGGGVAARAEGDENSGSVTLTGSTLESNIARRGGGMLCYRRRCVCSGNAVSVGGFFGSPRVLMWLTRLLIRQRSRTRARAFQSMVSGMYSEVNTFVTNSTFAFNQAFERGGGAAFRPSPCIDATARIVDTLFDGNQGTSCDPKRRPCGPPSLPPLLANTHTHTFPFARLLAAVLHFR